MKITIFGSTGGTGKALVARALEQGHDVTAVARKPEAITTKHERLHVVKGDVMDEKSVIASCAGAEAVLSTIGPADNSKPGNLFSVGVKNMLAGCEQNKVPRFVFESGLMAGDGTGLGFFSRLGTSIFRKKYFAMCLEKRAAEKSIQESKVDWVIVRPPGLDNSRYTGKYITGVNAPINAVKFISNHDVAEFMLKAASDKDLVRTIQTIGH